MISLRFLLTFTLLGSAMLAAEYHGQVKFGGLPVPGASVTATRDGKSLSAITDEQGAYTFPNLSEGTWTMQVEMQGFATSKREVSVGSQTPAPADWDLQMLPFADLKAAAVAPAETSFKSTAVIAAPSTTKGKGANPAAGTSPGDSQPSNETAAELTQRAADGFLINGAANNGASSPFSLAAAFGNQRKGPRSLYNGNIGVVVDNSALDARSFSLTGQDTAKPAYNHLTGLFSFGGPIRIPRLLPTGPNFVVNYQWTRNRNASIASALMPTAAERAGILPTGTVPADQISPQARALLNLYPLPNFNGSARYNFQIPMVGVVHQDSLQARLNKSLGTKNQLSGVFSLDSTRTDSPNLFGFLDTVDTLGLNASANWRYSFTPRLYGTLGFQYSRMSSRVKPYFENRDNISGNAQITGNDQEPINWGPPNLMFSSGIAGLSDASPSFNRNQTSALSYAAFWNHGRHNIFSGADLRRQQFNYLSQQDPRGTFTFTGENTGSDFGNFLRGVPDAAGIAFGNADKYFRAWSNDAYVTDDWRVNPSLTLNAGVRWEYASPITEVYGRLVNLDVSHGFGSVVPVVGNSLLAPDKHGFQPRIGLSWRPLPASSMVVRAGYGINYNTSVYQSIAIQMAQQSPLSKSLSVQNTIANPLTLANGFSVPANTISNTFAVDPNFRVGFTHNWQISVQRDLPAALILTATYLGIKGTRGMQEFLPNTYPTGAANPCLACPTGFVYLASNGNSTREAGQLQVRRRLHNGFTASIQYTFSKSIDDAALGGRGQGGVLIAQDWLNLRGERGLSNFDQRHVVAAQVQYSTGMGIGGGTLLDGWMGRLVKEWTLVSQINAGTGLPLTPIYPAAVRGTGVTASIRPDYTGAPVYSAPEGLNLNPAAFAAPASGHWGNAGRDSITGPGQFTMQASMGRTFRSSDRISYDLRIDATNALNHVTFPNWNTVVGNAQFGLPNTANAMRSVQTTFRVRF